MAVCYGGRLLNDCGLNHLSRLNIPLTESSLFCIYRELCRLVQQRRSRNDRRSRFYVEALDDTCAVGCFPTCSLSACLRSSSLRSCSISSYLLLCSRSCCFLISRSRRCCCRWKQVSVIIIYNRFTHSGHKSCSCVDAARLRLS